MSTKHYIGNSPYTQKWLLLSLAEESEEFQNLRSNAEVQNVDVKEISGKNGFCSKIYLCTVHFVDGQNFEAILKVPETGDMAEILKDTDSEALYVSLVDNLRKSDETFGPAVEKILPYVKDPDFIQHCFYSAHESHNLPAVFVHGDLWVNNVLWKKNPDGSASNQVAAYVDWQLSHSGCQTTDLASALVICTDAHIRRQYTEEVLQLYYDTLKAEVGHLEFSLHDIKKLYEINFAAQVFALMICSGHLPALIGHLPVKVQEAQMEKFKVRVKLAVQDLLEIGFPKDFPRYK